MLKQSKITEKNLVHTSYWMQPWAHDYIQQAAKLSRLSQAAVINAIVIDFWLRSLPRARRAEPEYAKTRQYVDMMLSYIR